MYIYLHCVFISTIQDHVMSGTEEVIEEQEIEGEENDYK